MIPVYDAKTGAIALYVDGERAYDEAGATIALPPAGADERDMRLCASAANLMSGRPAPLSPAGLVGEAAKPFEGRALRDRSGRPFLMDLNVGDVSIAPTVAAYDVHADGCVGDVIAPARLVPHYAGYYFPQQVGDATKLVAAGSLNGDAQVVSPGYVPTKFTTTSYALRVTIPTRTLENADFDLRRNALVFLVEKLRLMREIRLFQIATTSTNWATGNRVAAAVKWNGTSPTPLVDLFAALLASGMPADTLVLPESGAPYFFAAPNAATAPNVRDYVQAGGQLPRVLFSRAKQANPSAASDEANEAFTYVWAPNWSPSTATSTNVALLRCPGDPDSLPSLATFRWLGEGRDGRRVEGVLAREFLSRDGEKTTIVVAHSDAEVLASAGNAASSGATVGAVITGALA